MESQLERLDLNEAPGPYDGIILRSLADPEHGRERQLLMLADAAFEAFVLDPESVSSAAPSACLTGEGTGRRGCL